MTIRCPACKGMKKVMKIGGFGFTGDCETCSGIGHIMKEESKQGGEKNAKKDKTRTRED